MFLERWWERWRGGCKVSSYLGGVIRCGLRGGDLGKSDWQGGVDVALALGMWIESCFVFCISPDSGEGVVVIR